MLHSTVGQKIVPNIQCNDPLVKLDTVSSCPIPCYQEDDIDTRLLTTCFQVVVHSDKVSPQPPFLQTEDPHFTQLCIRALALYGLHQLRCSSLDVSHHRPQLRPALQTHQHKPLGSRTGLPTAQGLRALNQGCQDNSMLSQTALLGLLALPPTGTDPGAHHQTRSHLSASHNLLGMKGTKTTTEHTLRERPGLKACLEIHSTPSLYPCLGLL